MRLLFAFIVGISWNCSVKADDLRLTWSEPAKQQSLITPSDQAIYANFAVIQQFLQRNLALVEPLEFRFSSQLGLDYDTELQRIRLPVDQLNEVWLRLQQRYPEQLIVRETIYAAALQHRLFHEFVRALAYQQKWEVAGSENDVFDSIAVLLQLHQNIEARDYILDAFEYFLLYDKSLLAFNEDRFSDEFAADEQRYSNVLCLVTGFDAWNDRTEQSPVTSRLCVNSYGREMRRFEERIAETLKADNQIQMWFDDLPSEPTISAPLDVTDARGSLQALPFKSGAELPSANTK